MPKQVVLAMLIEAALITFTSLLLTQPALIFSWQSEKAKSLAKAGGMFLLCITFCWSVIFGCLLALNSITLRL